MRLCLRARSENGYTRGGVPVRVVVHLAGSVHALQDAQALQLLTVLEGGVLDAAVTVEHQAR